MCFKVHTVMQVTLRINIALILHVQHKKTEEFPLCLVCENDMLVANGFSL